jgi:hypothetical protein
LSFVGLTLPRWGRSTEASHGLGEGMRSLGQPAGSAQVIYHVPAAIGDCCVSRIDFEMIVRPLPRAREFRLCAGSVQPVQAQAEFGHGPPSPVGSRFCPAVCILGLHFPRRDWTDGRADGPWLYVPARSRPHDSLLAATPMLSIGMRQRIHMGPTDSQPLPFCCIVGVGCSGATTVERIRVAPIASGK